MKKCVKCNYAADETEDAQWEEKLKQLKENMILTSAPFVDGYRVKKHLGLVFGETVFKASFGKSLESSIEDLGNLLTFQSTEMSGIVSHMDRARDFALSKLISKAAERGANAVIAIDAETTIPDGTGFAHVSIYGTAVLIEKIEKEHGT